MRSPARSLLITLLLVSACSKAQQALDDARLAASFDQRNEGGEVEVALGERFEVVLGSPRGVAPEYRHTWAPQPSIEGGAIEFEELRETSPGANVDGGSYGYHYRFRAVAPGDASISIAIASRGEEAPTGPYRLRVRVSGE